MVAGWLAPAACSPTSSAATTGAVGLVAATTLNDTVYRNDSMLAWNEALVRIAAERDNMQVLRWSERVLPS